MDFYNFTSAYCNKTNNTSITGYVYNLTSSYTDQSNEASTVATSVVMFLLAALFFNLNLFSRLSDVSAVVNPSIRLFLSTSLSLFLPVMSYLFSEAKNAGAVSSTSPANSGPIELSLRARLILTWMLLVELLRKKVEAILINAGMLVQSSTIERAGRIAWLGYLVFFNLQSAGRRAVFGILWVLTATKMVQRVAITELGKRSFAYGRNTRLLTAYMAQMLEQEQKPHVGRDEEDVCNALEGSELLKSCKYAVMGEESLVKEADQQGYHLELKEVRDNANVTVGKIWTLAAEHDSLFASDPRLKRLCLSFALFKLLRRRCEGLVLTKAETCNCRDLIFKGLCKESTDSQAAAVALFQVMNNELNFLSEYYHSIHPVVFASPFFFLVNYFLIPFIVWLLCLMIIILCGNGDVSYVFHSIGSDNYAISTGVTRMMGCLASQVLKSPPAFFSTVDLSITCLLFLTFFYEEVWEFLVFLLSNWFMVSLLCSYTAKPHWRKSPTIHGAIRGILWVRNKISHRSLSFRQFSVLRCFSLPMMMPTIAVPKEAKLYIMESLAAYNGNTVPVSNGKSALVRYNPQLSWACESESIGEVILIWHIATSLFEMNYPEHKETASSSNRKVATRLSKYCAYLVAFQPELLPDDQYGTERVYKAMKKELKSVVGCWAYYICHEATRYGSIMSIQERRAQERTVLHKGVMLVKKLMDGPEGNEARVWKLLAELWTELIIYAAPSSNEAHVKGHEQALAQGGEFITMLWALATHTGIARPTVASPPVYSDIQISS